MKILSTALAGCAAALIQVPLLLGTPLTASAAPLVERPIVIAHRGASGYLPEETMASYRLALAMGADFIEPDLFLTADGVLVARHDRSLNATTNVQAVAATDPDLLAKRAANGAFNVDQLTYADLQKLSARSRGTPTNGYAVPGNGYYEATDTFPIATLREVLDYAYETYVTTGRVVGVYPEVKTITGTGAAEYHLRMADAIVAMLGDPKYNGYFDGSLDNVYLQSFDGAVVAYFNSITHLPVAYLTGCPATAEAAQAIKAIADGVGFSHTSGAASAACVERAHAAGLLVHVYTLLSDPVAHEKVHSWGVDGVFGNHPDVTKAVRDAYYPLTATGFHPPVGMATVVQDPGDPEPVADAATTWLRAKAGSAVPLKFNVFDATSGEELVTMMGAVDRVRAFLVPGCEGPVGTELPYPTLATADGALRYDTLAGAFMLNWKTPKAAAGACYRVTFTARDGSALHAFVRTH